MTARAVKSTNWTAIYLAAFGLMQGKIADMFTALNTVYWNFDPTQPTGTLNVTLFNYAMSPYDSWNSLAWAGAFLVTGMVLVLSLIARTILLRNKVTHE